MASKAFFFQTYGSKKALYLWTLILSTPQVGTSVAVLHLNYLKGGYMRMYSKKIVLAAVPLAGLLWVAPSSFAEDDMEHHEGRSGMEREHRAEHKGLEAEHEAEHEAADRMDLSKREKRQMEKKHRAEHR